MREYTEISAYIRHKNTPALLCAITDLFAREGMLRVESSAKRFHHAPALENNRWAVHILTGINGWHLLRATPWNLWCDLPSQSAQHRFIHLVQRLSSPGFFISVVDHFPEAYGEILIEVDSKGRSVATGNWAEQDWPEKGSAPDTSRFYGRKLDVGHIAPRSPMLQTLWQQSQGLWDSGEQNADYDDCRGDNANEIFCRYLTRHLLGRSSWDVATPDDWPTDARHTLYFEWPAGDRPEPPEPEALPEPDVQYPDGSRVELEDAVLLDNGLASGRVKTFLYSGNSVSMVAIDIGQPGLRAIHVDHIAHSLQLTERNTRDPGQAAVRFLTAHAHAGEALAMYAYGMRHIMGDGMAKDARTGYEWLTQAADKGQAEAQFFVGVMSKDETKAVRYWRMAAEQGVELAQFELGVALTEGKGVAQDVREAMHWYTLASQQGNLAAQYNLGHLWIYSLKHTSDAKADAEWFKVQAENGDAPAQWVMGLCAEYGRGGAHQDPCEAVRYYQMGAVQEFGPAVCNLADKYEHGTGVQQDLAEALRLYLLAAEKNVTAAFYSLGNLCKDGRGVAQDDAQAIHWFTKAAGAGWEDAKSALREFAESEYRQAQHLLEQARTAALANTVMPSADDLYKKALNIYDPKDPEALALAFALHQCAADQGHPPALFQLGFMHLRGFATESDTARAVELYRQAAELGDADAQITLAELYEEGTILPKDPAEARRWYEEAAIQGRKDAQYKLGLRASPEPTLEEMGIQFTPPARTPKPGSPKRPWWRPW